MGDLIHFLVLADASPAPIHSFIANETTNSIVGFLIPHIGNWTTIRRPSARRALRGESPGTTEFISFLVIWML